MVERDEEIATSQRLVSLESLRANTIILLRDARERAQNISDICQEYLEQLQRIDEEIHLLKQGQLCLDLKCSSDQPKSRIGDSSLKDFSAYPSVGKNPTNWSAKD